MLGSPILYLKGTRIVMFQLSGFYYKARVPAGSGDSSEVRGEDRPWRRSATQAKVLGSGIYRV